jgi:protein gp37
MGAFTKIEWALHTFNPWTGCTKISAGCDNCYAELNEDIRFGRAEWGKDGKRYLTSNDNWEKPIRWNKRAAETGIRESVFCASEADVFEDHPDLPPWRERLWARIEETPYLIWMLLTKRPGNIPKMMPEGGFGPHVWLGTSIESQGFAKRIKPLLKIPATVHFVSAEPLLGPLDLREYLNPGQIDWVIAGGETGPGARPTDPQWFVSLRDQSIEFDVPYHFKQFGDWSPHMPIEGRCREIELPSGIRMYRVGKKEAGRLLGGRTWDERPVGSV